MWPLRCILPLKNILKYKLSLLSSINFIIFEHSFQFMAKQINLKYCWIISIIVKIKLV